MVAVLGASFGLLRVSELNRSDNLLIEGFAGDLQIVLRLQVEPPFGRCPEIPGEAQGGVGADGSLAADNSANAERRHPQGFGEVRGWTQGRFGSACGIRPQNRSASAHVTRAL